MPLSWSEKCKREAVDSGLDAIENMISTSLLPVLPLGYILQPISLLTTA